MKNKKIDCLIDFLSEEIPANMQIFLEKEIKFLFEKELANFMILFEKIQVFSSPRHLSILLTDMQSSQRDQTFEIKGPKIDSPAIAIEGFLKSNKAKMHQLKINKTSKGEFYFYNKFSKGEKTSNLLSEIIQKVCTSINWPKSQRWGYSDFKWGRPLRNIMVIFDNKKIKGGIRISASETLEFKNYTFGHRSEFKKIKVKCPKDFVSIMKKSKVFVKRIDRKKIIEDQITKTTKKLNLTFHSDEDLLNEVLGLVENPNVLIGKIEKQFMNLPFEVLSIVMKVHQKYFSLLDQNMNIAPYFLVVSNLKSYKEIDNTVINGNERVLKARLSDALFFWENDFKKDIAFYLNKLKTIVFYENLGNLYQRSLRLSEINKKIGPFFNFYEKETLHTLGLYSKLDLSSNLVDEFPELQGIMLKYLARANNFNKSMQIAFEDQYKPVRLNKVMPRNELGCILSISNNIDTLSSFFSIGLLPTGSRDPFALRRSANSVISILWFKNISLSIVDVINSLDKKRIKDFSNVENDLKKFLIDRLKNFLIDEGFGLDKLSSVISGENIHKKAFSEIKKSFIILDKILNSKTGQKFILNFKRIYNITKKIDFPASSTEIQQAKFKFKEEKQIHNFILKLNKQKEGNLLLDFDKNFKDLLKEFNFLVEQFFENVLVNDKDQSIKNNRIKLLINLKSHFNKTCNFEKVIV